jgi:LysM repeat protein
MNASQKVKARVVAGARAAPQKIKTVVKREIKESIDSFRKPKRAVVTTAARKEITRVATNAKKEKAPRFHDSNWSSWASAPAPRKKKVTSTPLRKTSTRKASVQYRTINLTSTLPAPAFSFGMMTAPRKTISTRSILLDGPGSWLDPRFLTPVKKKKPVSKKKKPVRRKH